MDKRDKYARGEVTGLIGGSADRHLDSTKLPVIEHPLFLDPVRRQKDVDALTDYIGTSGVWVEIGFGKGLFLKDLAAANPNRKLLGSEVRYKLCLRALERLTDAGTNNARILLGDARQLMTRFFPEQCIEALFILFPDPWWKKKHHKKRLFHPEFLDLIRPLLKDGCEVVIRTDVPMVAELAEETFRDASGFSPIAHASMPLPLTDRERVCRRIGIEIEERFYQFKALSEMTP